MEALDRIITGSELFDLMNGKDVTCLTEAELAKLAREIQKNAER